MPLKIREVSLIFLLATEPRCSCALEVRGKIVPLLEGVDTPNPLD
jgi:hypothetical protein